MANNKDIKRGIVLYLDGKAVENSSKAIRKEMAKVKAELDKLVIGTDEYTAKARQYQALNAALKEHKAQMMGAAAAQQNWLNKGISLFNKYSVAILGAAAAITGVAMQLSSFRKKMNEKEESQANLKALTGLDDESIAWLTRQAEELSTTMERSGLRVRQSAQEILDAYTMVGSKKPELLQDKEALNAVTIEAMRLANAAKIDLKDAVAGVTLAMNQYGAAADEASRYVNVLAAGSKYGAVGVATQTESIVKAGVACSVAKVPIEQLVGVLETLGERGIEGNRAGTQLKTFFLKLEAGAEETRPSVVGLQQALDTLRAKGMDAGEMVKMFGLESYTAAAALINSADKVKYYTEAVTGTNVATEQAAINSETAAAKMAQLRNQISETGMALAKDLAPIFSKTINLTSKFIMALPPVVTWLKQYGMQLLVVIATLLIYNTRLIIAEKVTTALRTAWVFATTQLKAFRTAMAAYHLTLTGATNAQVMMNTAVKSGNIVTNAAVIVVGLLRTAYYALTLQMTACTRSLKLVRAALAESGWGLAILAIGAVVAAIINHNQKIKEQNRLLKEAREAEKKMYEEYDNAKAKIKSLHKVASDNNASLEDRKKAIDKLKEIAPDYHGTLDKEGKLINNNTTALTKYLDKLKESILYEALKQKLIDLYKEQADAEDKAAEASKKYWDITQKNTLSGYKRTGLIARAARTLGIEAEDNARKSKEKAEKDLEDVNRKIEETEAKRAELAKKLGISDGGAPSADNGDDEPENPHTPTETDEEREKRVTAAIEAIEAEHSRKLAELKKQRMSGEIATDLEYQNKVQQLELETLNKKLGVAGLEPKKREEIQNKILDIKMSALDKIKSIEKLELESDDMKLQKLLQQNELAHNERLNDLEQALNLELITQERYNELKLLADAEYNRKKEKAMSEQAEKDLSKQRTVLQASLNLLKRSHLEDNSTEDEYKKKRSGIINDFYEQALQNQNLSQEQRRKLQQEYDQAQLEQEEEVYNKHKEHNESLLSAYQQLGEDLGSELAEFVTSTEKSLGDLAKATLDLILNTLEKIFIAAVVERQVRNFAKLGYAGLLKAAAETALITAAFETAKAAIKSFDVGGYTGQGEWNEPAGVVHRGEFVANRFAVANPDVKNILDIIDRAQRNGTVQNLTKDDIRSVGFAHGGYASHMPSSYRPASRPSREDSELAAVVRECTDTMQSVRSRFDKPIIARTYATGKYGTIEAENLVDKMNKNASR